MDAQIARLALPGSAASIGPGLIITAFAFDTSQELLWAGNESVSKPPTQRTFAQGLSQARHQPFTDPHKGVVASFYGSELQKYTSYRAHFGAAHRHGAAVKQLLFCDKGIISLSSRSVHLASRKGVTQWHLGQPGMADLRCMSFTTARDSEIVVAGCQSELYRIDVEKGVVLEVLSPEPPVAYSMMRRAGQWICAASHDGSIHLLSPKDLSVAHSWKAYAGSVSDMDARGDLLLTCGWAQQQYHGLGLERLVRVYDLKTRKAMAPVTFGQGAAYVRMHPKLSSTCIVVSQTGAIQSIDVQNPDVPVMRFAQTFDAQLTGLELMPSGKGFAMSDSHGQVAVWGSATKMQFTEYPHSTEFAEPSMIPPKTVDWNSDLPLNLIGMPYYREPLFSAWPNSLIHEVGAPPVRIDPAVLSSMRKFEHGAVGPNPRKTRRNQAQNTRRSANKDSAAFPAPKFLSEQRKDDDGQYETERRLSEDISKTLSTITLAGGAPIYYHPQKMAYSKFGVDDFDFRYFNQTRYSGLEIHIVNAYANPLLQVFRFTNVVRNLALQHTARDCRHELCMLCETGFVIDMLEKAQGLICQATNFYKALSKQPNAAGLAFLEEHTFNTSLGSMIQNLIRYLLPTLESNYRRVGPVPAEMHFALGTVGRAYSVCTACAYEDSKEQVWFSHDLIYPQKTAKHSPRNTRQPFSRLLKDTVERYEQHRGWCMRCQGYKAIRSRRTLHRIPAVLTINAAAHTSDAKQHWGTAGFLPREIGIIVRDDQFYCYEGQDLQLHLQRRTHDITVYELVGVVAEVTLPETSQSHLVTLINTTVSEIEPVKRDAWHLFNDFMVRPVSVQEALHFDPRWKTPCVLTYQMKHMSHHLDDSWKTQIDTSILYRSVSQPAFTPTYQCRPLSSDDPMPSESMHCAIDAEFVRLLREEIDMDADGKRNITRPARSGLARVSVLRGDEPDQQLPFIDDYIAIDDSIDDYLTAYSGLHPGDLTPGISRFTLVGLKEVYKKLWVLLNLGVTFIGHGLSSDFRTINIHVPEARVLDTQELFSLGSRTRRKLSLRFLAWLLLHEDIQRDRDAGHDSIEDARAALLLWRKFCEFQAAGVLEQVKDDIYAQGRHADFKVPAARADASAGLLAVPGGGGRRGAAATSATTPVASAPGTPERRIASLAPASTPARSEFGSPLR